MDKKLYDLMDWAGIEEIVYSEAATPTSCWDRMLPTTGC